jgi:hypothetical protein
VKGPAVALEHGAADAGVPSATMTPTTGMLTCTGSAGKLHALDPATGQALAQIPVGETSRFATPAIYGSVMLVPAFTGAAYAQTP